MFLLVVSVHREMSGLARLLYFHRFLVDFPRGILNHLVLV